MSNSATDYVLPLSDDSSRMQHIQARRYDPITNELLRRYVRPGMNCLELGCGAGASTQTICEILGQTGSLICVEQGQAYIDYTRHRLEINGYQAAEFIQASAEEVEVPSRRDLIFGRAVLHHMRKPDDVYAKCAQALAPGGILFIMEPVIARILNAEIPTALATLVQWYLDLGRKEGFHFNVGSELGGFARSNGLTLVEMGAHEEMLLTLEDRSFYTHAHAALADLIVAKEIASANEVSKLGTALNEMLHSDWLIPVTPMMFCIAMRL